MAPPPTIGPSPRPPPPCPTHDTSRTDSYAQRVVGIAICTASDQCQLSDRVAVQLIVNCCCPTSNVPVPDGRWIAYASEESGRGEIYVRSFPDGEGASSVYGDVGLYGFRREIELGLGA
ncbi:MAG TPA: hypothetical protein EYM78_13335 [Gemmatimonadetes bacterium]|nr:hypothetical protein [Gemmatimonadota bacterium]HIN51663.1 hypothetical protein [Gemmatimonadota bacterium]